MELTTALGLMAGTLTTVAYLPQLVKIWKSKSAGDVSWAMLIVLCAGILLWLIYGTSIQDVPVIAANGVTLAFATTILGLKIKFSRA